MIDNKNQDFSDEMIRSFLLGELGGEQSQFEERLFTDDDLATRVRLAELDLCDDYASSRISGRERQIFRERFLITGDRKQALLVSSALDDRFRTKSTEHSLIERIRNLINVNQAVWKYAFAVLILIIVLTMALLVTKDHSRIAGFEHADRFVACDNSSGKRPQIDPVATNVGPVGGETLRRQYHNTCGRIRFLGNLTGAHGR